MNKSCRFVFYSLPEDGLLYFELEMYSCLLKTAEKDFYNALNEAKPKYTKIIVAQRIASVKQADRIVVLENGVISACGTHEELLKNCDIYKDIYNSQLGEK